MKSAVMLRFYSVPARPARANAAIMLLREIEAEEWFPAASFERLHKATIELERLIHLPAVHKLDRRVRLVDAAGPDYNRRYPCPREFARIAAVRDAYRRTR